jgi:hypothetical protein
LSFFPSLQAQRSNPVCHILFRIAALRSQ